MLVERGDSLAEKKDYNAAYNAYRQAYSFDPANELALIKMRRMLEAQGLAHQRSAKERRSRGTQIQTASRRPESESLFLRFDRRIAREPGAHTVAQYSWKPLREDRRRLSRHESSDRDRTTGSDDEAQRM